MALKQELDTPIHEQVRQLMHDAYRERMAPIGIVFSRDGLTKATAQTVPGMDPWSGRNGGHPTHYLGLPFSVDKYTDAQPDVRLDLVPGSSPEAKAFRAARTATQGKLTPPLSSVAIRFAMDSTDPRMATMHVLGQHLTRAQLSDIIQAWVDAHPNEQPVTDMLVDWVQTHGRFE